MIQFHIIQDLKLNDDYSENDKDNNISQTLINNIELDNNDYSDVFKNGHDDINGSYNDELLNEMNNINIYENKIYDITTDTLNIRIIQDLNIFSEDEKEELDFDFDINKLNIHKDSKWQDIPKKIFGINKDVDLDEYLLNIDLKPPVNSFFIFCREKTKYLHRNLLLNDMHNMILKAWNELNKEDKQKYLYKSYLERKYYEKKKRIVNKYIFIYYDFIKQKALTPSKLFKSDAIIRKLDST